MVKYSGPTDEGALKKQAKNHLGKPIFEDLGQSVMDPNDLTTMLGQPRAKAGCRRQHTNVRKMAAP